MEIANDTMFVHFFVFVCLCGSIGIVFFVFRSGQCVKLGVGVDTVSRKIAVMFIKEKKRRESLFFCCRLFVVFGLIE